MKTLKFLVIVCIILAISTYNANPQSVVIPQTVYWVIGPNSGGEHTINVPCMIENVSGDVFEELSITNKTFHVQARGVLTGVDSGDLYEVDYGWNSFISPENAYNWHGVLPMRLRHNGKLATVIHLVFQFQYNGQEVVVVNRIIDHIDCK